MKARMVLVIGVVMGIAVWVSPAPAQSDVFPLPAPLYILTSQHEIIAVDPAHGGQTVVSPPEQPVVDFDIAPDGEWYAYRTSANNLVIVAQLVGRSGYVLEFSDSPFPDGSPAQTIAWSPDAARLAYIIGEGVRIAELGAGEYGQTRFSTVQGPWIELYWAAPETLIASDVNGQTTRIQGAAGQWQLEVVTGVSARPQEPVPSYLSAQGVALAGGGVVPGTAGALAFDWGPEPPPLVTDVSGVIVLPADLYFLAPDVAGVRQVWRLPRAGAVHPLTAETMSVSGYGVSPDGSRLALVRGEALVVTGRDGGASERRMLATLALAEGRPAQPDWSPDGTRLAYHDDRGVWVVAVSGDSPPRLLAQSMRLVAGGSPADVRVYYGPAWSPDGRHLLVTIGLWEGAAAGVVDVATGTVTPLEGVPAGRRAWTDDGRVLVWSRAWGFQDPGLWLFDPAVPDSPPQALLPSGTPVLDVRQHPDGGWRVLLARTPAPGPQYLFVAGAEALDGPFRRLYEEAGGFAAEPVLGVAVAAPAIVAGLRGVQAGDGDRLAGTLVLVDMSTGVTVRVQTAGLASDPRWGP